MEGRIGAVFIMIQLDHGPINLLDFFHRSWNAELMRSASLEPTECLLRFPLLRVNNRVHTGVVASVLTTGVVRVASAGSVDDAIAIADFVYAYVTRRLTSHSKKGDVKYIVMFRAILNPVLDMKKLQEVETVVVYENEERRMDRHGRLRWMPHETFPFDDEGGNVVDIATLNLTVALPKAAAITPGAVVAAAGMLTSSTPSGWRWANDTTDAHAPRYGAFKMHRRELQSWQAGKWMYAERWPSREEEQQGTFQWSSTAGAGVANVRRRRLSRNRINIAIEAAREARHQEYLKKLEQLRMELGL